MTNNIFLVYFSSHSNNTHRFIQKLGFTNKRIPINLNEQITLDKDYVLVCPTYSGGGSDFKGSIPKQVIQFLNNKENRKHCKGIIASGNSNFGQSFGIAGNVLQEKLKVPFLYKFEILGTQNDVKNIQDILIKFFKENNLNFIDDSKKEDEDYYALNAKIKFFKKNVDNFAFDKQALDSYFKNYINKNTLKFDNLKQRLDYLIKNDYYDKKIIDLYSFEEIEELNKLIYSYNFKFLTFMGALKFYNSYALKTFDHKYFLEHYEDRVLMNVLFLANGNFEYAKSLAHQLILGRYQPATPTFLNAGKKNRGEFISCYLLRVEDNMESIARSITTSLQLSKRGGGVAICLTNLRELGAPIKKIKNQSSGIIPVMKILENSFSYANQLGQRQGAGVVYLNIHHPDIELFLDTKRENADEKIRIKSLSLGLMVTNIAFELAKENKDLALFSPYDIYNEYKKPMTDISITKEYQNLINNDRIKKTYINARKLFLLISELHFESGYPYLIFDDTVNENNPNDGRIVMSNLCSEIIQTSTPSQLNPDLSYKQLGEDIACNLGSLNIAKIMESGLEFEKAIQDSVYALDFISRNTDLSIAPTIENGNKNNHAIGLGAMNLHGFFATNGIFYDSPEALDFVNMFFYTVAYNSFKASHQLALKYKPYANFKTSKYASGKYFDKYTSNYLDWTFKTEKVKKLFEEKQIKIPTKRDWQNLVELIKKDGIANSNLLAIAPTGSISYLTSSTPSLQPVVSYIETRKEGKLGRVYVPAYKIDKYNLKYYAKDAYELGPFSIIDIVATAQQHVDQAISMTLFMKDDSTTRDLNKAYIYAFKKKCTSIYYVRVRQDVLEGSENYDECESCVV